MPLNRRSAPSRAPAPRGGGSVMGKLVPCQGELLFGAGEGRARGHLEAQLRQLTGGPAVVKRRAL